MSVRLWTPADLTLPLWLRPDDLAGADGSSLALWPDAAGDHDGSAPAPKRPIVRTNRRNGLPAVYFGGASYLDLLQLGDTLSGDDEHEWLFVLSPEALASYPVFVAYPPASGWTYIIEFDPSGDLYFGSGGSRYNLLDASVAQNAWALLGVRKTGPSTVEARLSGGAPVGLVAQNGGGHGPTPAMSGDVRLGGCVDPNYSMRGLIGEVILDTTPSTDRRQKLEGYAAWKWGFALAAGHPYAGAAPTVTTEDPPPVEEPQPSGVPGHPNAVQIGAIEAAGAGAPTFTSPGGARVPG